MCLEKFNFILILELTVYLCEKNAQKVKKKEEERRWTIIALRSLKFYFWSNIELTWHECSFVPQITNNCLQKKLSSKKIVVPILGPFKIGFILSICLHSNSKSL